MNLSIASKLGIFAVASFALLAACDTTPPVTPDTTAPVISSPTGTSITPDIDKAANVVVKFNEAMDATTTLAAVSITPSVAFTKSVAGSDLTLKPPTAGWTEGTTYTVKIAKTAADASDNKNPLGTDKTFTFKVKTTSIGTFKTLELAPVADATILLDIDGTAATATTPAVVGPIYSMAFDNGAKPPAVPAPLTTLRTGDLGDGVARGAMRFDLSGLPAGAVIDSATLTLTQTALDPAAPKTPFGAANLGNLDVLSVDFPTAFDKTGDPKKNFEAAVKSTVAGAATTFTGAAFDVSVTAAVTNEAAAAGDKKADFVLKFSAENSLTVVTGNARTLRVGSNDNATVASKPKLVIKYK